MDPLLLDAAIPDGEVKDKLVAYGITNVTQLAQQYADTRHAFDSSIRAPGEGATAEALAEFHRKMGAPESADGYGIPEGVGQSQLGQTLDMLRGVAHTKGMPVDTWNAFAQEATTANQAVIDQRAQKLADLKEGWKTQAKEQFGDKFDTIKARGQQIINTLAGADPELKALFAKTGMDNHPKILEAFAKVAAITSPEITPPGLEGTHVSAPIDQARELRSGILEIMTSEPYKRKSDPKHEVAMQKFYAKQKQLAALGFNGATDPRLQPEYLTP